MCCMCMHVYVYMYVCVCVNICHMCADVHRDQKALDRSTSFDYTYKMLKSKRAGCVQMEPLKLMEISDLPGANTWPNLRHFPSPTMEMLSSQVPADDGDRCTGQAWTASVFLSVRAYPTPMSQQVKDSRTARPPTSSQTLFLTASQTQGVSSTWHAWHTGEVSDRSSRLKLFFLKD